LSEGASNIDDQPRERNIALLVEYDGTDFFGWQRQARERTVQQTLEEALEDLTGHHVRLTSAGRTDTRVHARGQVASFFTNKTWDADVFARAMGSRLKNGDVWIKAAWDAPSDFNPRKDAILRTYCYRLWNRRIPPVLDRNCWAHYIGHLDFEKIRAASQLLIGEHDFSGFRSSQCSAKRTLLDLQKLDWEEIEPGKWEMTIACRSFLHNMVRVIVGTLLEIGRGGMTLDDLQRVIEVGDRKKAGPTANPQGLTLERVDYPFSIPPFE